MKTRLHGNQEKDMTQREERTKASIRKHDSGVVVHTRQATTSEVVRYARRLRRNHPAIQEATA